MIEHAKAMIDLSDARSERLFVKHFSLRGLGVATVGFNQGGDISRKPVPSRSIEDCAWVFRAADGTAVLLVTDGVGETYHDPTQRKLYDFQGQTTLGDIPGRILAHAVNEQIVSGGNLHTIEGIQLILDKANQGYRDFLRANGLDSNLNGGKQLLGGCTFALAVVRPDESGFVASAGDAIGIVKPQSGEPAGTMNQLPEVNAAFEGAKRLLEDELAAAGSPEAKRDMRLIFNAMVKRLQRNEFTNVAEATIDRTLMQQRMDTELGKLLYLDGPQRASISQKVMALIPDKVPGYGFFDGNNAVRENLQVVQFGAGSELILCTDGAFPSAEKNPVTLHETVVSEFVEGGVEKLLHRNQNATRGTGPEATVIHFIPSSRLA